jgi:manganese transport protein
LKDANKFNLIDSIVALNAAFFVNAAILVLAAAVFFTTGHSDVASIIDAHALLAPLLGSKFAPIAFGVALLAAGQSSTITGTFAGQIVMEGFVGLKMRPWLRRILTRMLAIIPTVIVIKISGDNSVNALLVLSQVILSLQLPFAIVPLLHFTSSKIKMKEFASRYLVRILAWIAAGFIIILNLKLVYDFSLENFSDSGITGTIFKFVVIPVIVFLVLLLLWITIEPYFKKAKLKRFEEIFIKKPLAYARKIPAVINKRDSIMKIGIALEGKPERDEQVIKGIRPFLKNLSVEIYLIHCVETVTGRFIGNLVADEQAKKMSEYINGFAQKLNKDDFTTHTVICGGEPEKEIAKVCKKEDLELIVVGSHGHKMLKDIIYGATVDELRHRVRIPVLAIPVEV